MEKNSIENGWYILPQRDVFFCFVCRLFSSSSGALVTHGFSDD